MTTQSEHHDAEELSYGAGGGDEVVIVPWPVLFRRKVERRVTSSDRYRWWVLWSLLAGLFAVNFTFTIFAITLPRLARDQGASLREVRTTDESLEQVFRYLVGRR